MDGCLQRVRMLAGILDGVSQKIFRDGYILSCTRRRSHVDTRMTSAKNNRFIKQIDSSMCMHLKKRQCGRTEYAHAAFSFASAAADTAVATSAGETASLPLVPATVATSAWLSVSVTYPTKVSMSSRFCCAGSRPCRRSPFRPRECSLVR